MAEAPGQACSGPAERGWAVLDDPLDDLLDDFLVWGKLMSLENLDELSWIYDLYRLGQEGALSDNPAEIQQRIIEHIVQGLDADSGSLSLRVDGEDELVLTAGIGIPDSAIGKRIKRGVGVIGWVLDRGEPILLSGDVSQDARFRDRVPRRESAVPGSAICWPLTQDKRLIGVFCVNRGLGHPAFTEAEVEHGKALVNVVSIVIENTRLHLDQAARIRTLSELNQKLEEAQGQLLQSEKLASIGQLAAGVAHEINNPIGFVYSNLGTLQNYLGDMLTLLEVYESAEPGIGDHQVRANLQALKRRIDLDYLREDVTALVNESRDGISRVKKIVQDLKDFSHADSGDEWQLAGIEQGLDTTLNIVWNELKYKCDVRKEYGNVPDIECLPSQLNQVFMNMLVNAGHAIEARGTITLRTGTEGEQVWVEIEDTGKGISPEHMKRIFDPFFTTKPVGKGTGLGLSLSYSIVNKHCGRIEVDSVVGKGTRFRVWLPMRRQPGQEAGA